MTCLVSMLGALIVLAVLHDIFHTLLHPQGYGPLSRGVMRSAWWASRRAGRVAIAGAASTPARKAHVKQFEGHSRRLAVASDRHVPNRRRHPMAMHAWSEHVVHVELVSDDDEIARTARRFLEQRFSASELEVHGEGGQLRVHTEPERAVTAAQVSQALVEAGVRAHAVHERREWSVAEL